MRTERRVAERDDLCGVGARTTPLKREMQHSKNRRHAGSRQALPHFGGRGARRGACDEGDGMRAHRSRVPSAPVSRSVSLSRCDALLGKLRAARVDSKRITGRFYGLPLHVTAATVSPLRCHGQVRRSNSSLVTQVQRPHLLSETTWRSGATTGSNVSASTAGGACQTYNHTQLVV